MADIAAGPWLLDALRQLADVGRNLNGAANAERAVALAHDAALRLTGATAAEIVLGSDTPKVRGLSIPVTTGEGQLLGRLAAAPPAGGSFGPVQAALLENLATLLACALEQLGRHTVASEAEQRLRDFAEIGSDWLWETDAEHRLIYRSNPRRDTLSTPTERLLGGRRWELPGIDGNDPIWDAHRADLDARREFRGFEYDIRLADGSARRIRTSGRPVFGPDGGFLGYRGVGTDVTAMRAVEAEARSREADFRYLFQNNPNPMWVFDRASYRFLAVNDAAVAKYGYSREDFLRMTILDIRPPEDADRLVDSMRERDEAYRQAGGWRHRTKSGELIDVEIESHGLAFDDHTAILVLARDISARRRAEERLRDFVEISADWLWETDEQHRFVSFSESYRDTMGNDRDMLIGLKRWEIPGIVPSGGSWDEHMAALAAHHEFRDFEYRRIDAHGRTRHVSISGRPVFASDGRFMGYRGVASNITARRELEAAYRQMFEHNPNPMWIYDLETFAFLQVNDAAVARYGYSREEFLRMRLEDIRPPEDVERMRQAIAAQSATWTAAGTWRHITRSGETRLVELDTYRTEFAGRPAITVLVRDITERQEAAAKLAETEARLRQAQKLEAVGQLTGGVAHDFNNLLTVILGNLELIGEQPEGGPSLQRQLAAVQRAAQRGADLTRHLLAFARRQALDPRDTDINRLVLGLRDLIERTIGENVEVRIVPAEGLWSASIDPAQLETSLLNLAINARDAMQATGDGGKLTIETANVTLDERYAASNPDTAAGDYVMVSVSDTGTGMTFDVAAQAFDPFFTTKAHGKGSGLGLSMVYGFVKQSGGHVKIYSEVGHGTSVKLYLPRGLGAADAAAEAEKAPEVRGRETILVVEDDEMVRGPEVRGRETILVVEDDEMVRGIAVDHLVALGYQVLAAGNGVEALEILESGAAVDLLFTDVVMPGGMNGRQLAERACARWPHLKVLYTSGYTENAIVHHGRLDAGVKLLQKPYRRQTLASKIREALES
jgi:PAS domain S-box-containing protein